MQKQIGSNCQTKIFIAALTLLIFLFAPSSRATAQDDVDGKYKVGERVQCDFKFNGEYPEGTVVEIVGKGDKLTCCRYRVKFENDDPLWKDGRLCQERAMRALGKTEPVGEVDQKKTDPSTTKTATPEVNKKAEKPKAENPEDFTYLADREPLECPIEQTPVKNGARPNPELLKKVIRCLYERRAPAGITGAKTVDINGFVIGTPRKWITRSDIGNGNPETIVYPIKVTWTEKTFYESYTRQVDSISMFGCYVNAVGEWQCGLTQRIKESDVKRLPPKQ